MAMNKNLGWKLGLIVGDVAGVPVRHLRHSEAAFRAAACWHRCRTAFTWDSI